MTHFQFICTDEVMARGLKYAPKNFQFYSAVNHKRWVCNNGHCDQVWTECHGGKCKQMRKRFNSASAESSEFDPVPFPDVPELDTNVSGSVDKPDDGEYGE